MSKWIDAKELKKILKDPPLYASLGGMTLNDVFTLIDNEAPSIDIVHCEECEYWVSDGGDLMICDIHKDPTVPKHFCSYGEREDE